MTDPTRRADAIARLGGVDAAREQIANLRKIAMEKRQKAAGIVYGRHELKLFGVPLQLALAHLDAIDPEREAKVDRAIIAFGDATLTRARRRS